MPAFRVGRLSGKTGLAQAREHLPALVPGTARVPRLSGHGVQLGSATSASKGTIARVFNRFGLVPYFAHLVSGEDFAESKPDSATFRRAAELVETPVSEYVGMENSANGVAASKAADIFCVGYASPHSAGQDLWLADLVIQNFAELLAARLAGLA